MHGTQKNENKRSIFITPYPTVPVLLGDYIPVDILSQKNNCFLYYIFTSLLFSAYNFVNQAVSFNLDYLDFNNIKLLEILRNDWNHRGYDATFESQVIWYKFSMENWGMSQ